jgi:PAH dioxygenase small subunit
VTLASQGRDARHALRFDVEDFLFREAELLDERRFEDWLELFESDATYEAPVRVSRGDADRDVDKARIFCDTASTLAIRVRRLRTDSAWAESLPSRVRRFVTNVRVKERGLEIDATSNLLVYRNRGDVPGAVLFAASRSDTLHRNGDSFLLSSRVILLDQATLDSFNLPIFF